MVAIMKYPILVLVTIILSLFKNGETEALNVDSMDTWKTKIDVADPSKGFSSSGILQSHFGATYKTPFNKTLVLAAPNGYGMIAAIRMVDLRPSKLDSLTLSAVSDQKLPLVFTNGWSAFHNKTDDVWEWTIYDAPSGQISVQFVTGSGGVSTWGYDGFRLIYTAYKTTFCSYSQFNCLNGRCISNKLKCDGHNHCGNRREQLNCSYVPKRNVPAIASGVVFLVIAAACIIFIIIRRSSRSRTEIQTIINHPPPANLSGYPPSYSQPGTVYPPPPPAYTPYTQGKINQGYH